MARREIQFLGLAYSFQRKVQYILTYVSENLEPQDWDLKLINTELYILNDFTNDVFKRKAF